MIKIAVFFLLLSLNSFAQSKGIEFHSGDWRQIVDSAQIANKPIFIDFYTPWCNPCKEMSKNIFTDERVGNFYNNKFYCVKINAEEKEYSELVKKFSVKAFPTYIFVTSTGESIIHRSAGYHPAERFIAIGESALNYKSSSVYFELEKKNGNIHPEFLLRYATYKGISCENKSVSQIIDYLINIDGYGLDNPAVWDVFIKYVEGREGKAFEIFVKNIDTYRELYGIDIADEKLFSEYKNVSKLDEISKMPNFNGSIFLQLINSAMIYRDDREYSKAINYVDMLLKELKENKKYCFLCNSLASSNLYGGKHPIGWHDKCFELTKYIAYNTPNREDVTIHYNYAVQLELMIKRLKGEFNGLNIRSVEYNRLPREPYHSK